MELLDLSKAAHHDTVTLPGGAVREVINQTDLGVWEFAHLHSLQTEAGRLSAVVRGKKVTEKQQAELLRVLGELVKMLIPTITAAELKKLSRANREQVVLVWLANNNSAPGDAENPPEPAPQTGVGSSQGSRRSTGATRSAGGTSRSSRSSRT